LQTVEGGPTLFFLWVLDTPQPSPPNR